MRQKYIKGLPSLIFLDSYHDSLNERNVCLYWHLKGKTVGEGNVFPYGPKK